LGVFGPGISKSEFFIVKGDHVRGLAKTAHGIRYILSVDPVLHWEPIQRDSDYFIRPGCEGDQIERNGEFLGVVVGLDV